MNLGRKEIFLLYRDGVSQAEIARSAGVSRQRIHQIVGGPEYEAVRRRHADLVARYEANVTATRRTLRTVREDREARQRDRAFRSAYLQAHPRARVTQVRAKRVQLSPDGSPGGTSPQEPGLRLVV